MPLNSQYQIIDTLHENQSTFVYRALRLSDTQNVIIKMLKPSMEDESEIAQFTNEQQILSKLDSEKISQLLDVIALPSGYIHIFKDIGGNSLHNLLLHHQFSVEQGLEIALKIAKIIQYLHQNNVIHADINPNNIIYNIDTKELQIIDFGYSFVDNYFRLNKDIAIGTSGNLLYMSPEQTGRTRQKVDARSDLYSFGMTLYHLFLGHPPYEAKDRYELLHKQIALSPNALYEVNNNIPYVLSVIIEKLIEKKPKLRYQSDEAIIHDLQYCIKELKTSGSISNFEIATHDQPSLQIGNHLFGRDREILVLQQVAQEALSPNAVNLLVSGHSGVGKTRLIKEFFTYFNTSKVRIVRGKFDLYKTAMPYLTFKQIFIQLRTFLMSQSTTEGRCKIHPNSAYVLQNAFTELRDVFPRRTNKAIRSTDNLKAQLSHALKEFFEHIATEQHPLIIFIDDLQWSDQASTELIQTAILESSNPNLHFVGAYRDKEMQTNKNMLDLLHTLVNNTDRNTCTLKLLPLQENDLKQMIQKLLLQKGKNVNELISIIYKKTDGNPFYVKSWIQHLINNNELLFQNGKWEYSIEKIKSISPSINIAEIINAKYFLLSADEQFYLQHLALLGNRFSTSLTLKLMRSLKQSDQILENLVEKGFIEDHSSHYQFVHDQIQQHVFSLLDAENKQHFHHNIGMYFEKCYLKKHFTDIIFLVNHLNNAYTKSQFPKKIFHFNIKALEKMLLNSSHALAMELVVWIEENIFDILLWKRERLNTFKYVQLKVKILYLNRYLDEASQEIEFLIKKTRTTNERMECFSLFKDICITKGSDFTKLLTFGNDLLDELGLNIPSSAATFDANVQELTKSISLHPLLQKQSQIINLPKLQNKNKHYINILLLDYYEGAYYLADIGLMQWAYLTIISNSLHYGNSSESTLAYVLYGAQLISQKQYKKGYIFAKAAIKLNQQFQDEKMLPKIYNYVANFVNPYINPFSSNIALYQRSLQQSKINGDLVFGAWANFLMHFSDYLSGKSLNELRENITKESTFILNSGDEKMIAIFNVLKHTVYSLQKNTQKNSQEKAAVLMWKKDNFYPALTWFAILKAQSCFFEGSIDEGLHYLDKYVKIEANEVVMFAKIRLHFIRALLLLGKISLLDEFQGELLQADLHEFESFSKASPRNFKFERLLLKAEKMKNQKIPWNAAKLYDEALEEARKAKNPFFISLGSLCAGSFWKIFNYQELSRFYFNESIIGLNQWGAYEIANKLKKTTFGKDKKNVVVSRSNSNSSIMNIELANFQSLLKSFYAISQSKNTKELLHTLIQTILENATASKAILIFKEDEKFYTKAKMDFTTGEVELYELPLEKSTMLPVNILSYVINTKRKLSLEDPSQSGKFQFDPYIQETKPASCIIIPTLLEDEVRALLYLENKNIATPLKPETIKTLELLLTQAAILYTNTSLIEILKVSEYNLKRAQEISHVGDWSYSSANEKIIWSEETYRIYDLEPFSIPIDYKWFLEHLHPDDVASMNKAIEKALSGERYYTITHRIITSKGNIKTVQQHAEAYWNKDEQIMHGTIQDITEFKRTEDLISRLSQVVNQNPFATIITDKDAQIQFVNLQCNQLTGYQEHELLGKKMNIFHSGIHSRNFFSNLWKTIGQDKNIWRGTIINRMKDGKLLDCASTIFPIFNNKNEIINYVAIQEDVTEQNIKDKLFLMQTRQAQMGEMLSMIAHQWRQPLSIISTLTNKERMNILLEKSTEDNTLKNYDNIELQVKYLSQTISDFRDFFKPDKTAVITKSSIIISKTLILLGNNFEQKNIEIQLNHRSDPSYTTFEHEMEQVILNLLKNAQDIFEERNIEGACIFITTDEKDGQATIIIEDNAQGINLDIIDTLFLPYVSTKEQLQGNGLGLYMSKTIVEDHCHGKINVKNTDIGAKFTITIPLRQDNV